MRKDLVAVSGGQLHLHGVKNDDLSKDKRPVLTGGVSTRGRFAMKYGKIELRCKFEGQKGAWPAVWMMPENPSVRWPSCGEIDIVERLNSDGFVHQTVHSAWTKKYPKWEYADFYRAGNLKKTNAVTAEEESAPPWTGETPAVEKYNWRGCRMLARRNWGKRCFTCKWAAMANVAIEYDWGRRQKYRFESFCYGPRSCPFYDMGAPRAVPYKDCGEDYDQGWMDDICTQNRKDDDE
jgi:hypothetical protein